MPLTRHSAPIEVVAFPMRLRNREYFFDEQPPLLASAERPEPGVGSDKADSKRERMSGRIVGFIVRWSREKGSASAGGAILPGGNWELGRPPRWPAGTGAEGKWSTIIDEAEEDMACAGVTP